MWMPEIRTGNLGGHRGRGLIETASFDAKVALPAKGKSKDLAIDVARWLTTAAHCSTGLVRTRTRRPTVPKPFVSPVPANAWIRSCVPPSPSLPTFRYVRFRRMMILVSATSWSPFLRRHGHPIWSRWARNTDTTGAAPRATCLSRRGKWLACTSGVSGGRWIVMRCSTGYRVGSDTRRTRTSPIFTLSPAPWCRTKTYLTGRRGPARGAVSGRSDCLLP